MTEQGGGRDLPGPSWFESVMLHGMSPSCLPSLITPGRTAASVHQSQGRHLDAFEWHCAERGQAKQLSRGCTWERPSACAATWSRLMDFMKRRSLTYTGGSHLSCMPAPNHVTAMFSLRPCQTADSQVAAAGMSSQRKCICLSSFGKPSKAQSSRAHSMHGAETSMRKSPCTSYQRLRQLPHKQCFHC